MTRDEPDDWTPAQERAIERADREADRSFERGNFDCVSWALDQLNEGDDALLLWYFLSRGRGKSDNWPGALNDPVTAAQSLRSRLYGAWQERHRGRALADLADAPRAAAEDRAEREHDEARARGA